MEQLWLNILSDTYVQWLLWAWQWKLNKDPSKSVTLTVYPGLSLS